MEKGFTLLEMLVVLAVISIFAGVIGSIIGTSITSAEIEASQLKLDDLKQSMLSYYEDTDRFPQDTGDAENDLQALTADPGVPGWDGPYISSGFEDDDFIKDGWNRTVVYSYTDGDVSCVVRSSGPDGTGGNGDDIVLTIDATTTRRDKVTRIRDELEVVKVAAQTYATDQGGLYPSSISDLYGGSYLSDESFRKDPWLTDYQVSGNQFISYGPDRNAGGGDDVYPY
jgi:general secretion pathway protein G